jgi:hypothetical protein
MTLSSMSLHCFLHASHPAMEMYGMPRGCPQQALAEVTVMNLSSRTSKWRR